VDVKRTFSDVDTTEMKHIMLRQNLSRRSGRPLSKVDLNTD
jgi:hypothetical protein